MPILKFANADLLEAQIAVPGGGLLKSAHKAVFNYEPREGFLYVRSRAISNRTNDNYDTWPEDELRQAYATFIGKPVFVNHHNDDVRRKRGVIIDAALHEDIGPDGRPDVWIEVLMEIDAIRFPRLAQAILAGDIERTSMGADVGESECSYCGNVATTPSTYCAHIKSFKGRRLARRNPDGSEEEVLVHEICIAQGEMVSTLRGLVPIESVVVGDMALTRAGWRRVTDARQTGVRPTVKITLSDGTTLRCTEDHLIATAAGWTPAVSLLVGDVDAEATVSVRALAGVHVGVLDGELVTSLAVGLEGMPVIEPVGDGVNQPEMARVDAVALSADVVDFDPLEIMPEKVHHSSVNQSFVVRVATDAPVSIGGSGSLPDQALILGNGSGEQSFQFVQAVCVSHDATVPVYDLTVEGEHEFVANGIVVHNCRKISFFENSVLVEPPADPTAYVVGVDASGVEGLLDMPPRLSVANRGDDGGSYTELVGDVSQRDLTPSGSSLASRRASRQTADLDHVGIVTLTEEQKARFAGTTVRQDDDGFYCHTHRARGKSYPSIDEIPDGEIGFIESTGAAKNFEEEVQQEMTKMATKKKDRWRKTAGALDYGPLAPGPRAGTRWEGIASTPNSRAYEVTVLWPGDEAPMLSGVFDSEERAQEWAQMCVDAGGRSVLIENAGNFQRVSNLRSEGATQAEADQLLVSLDPEHRRMLEKFVPYTVYGPNYNRSITSNLMDAIMFARRGEEKYFLLAWSKCEAALDIATGGEDNWYYDSAMGQYTKRLASSTRLAWGETKAPPQVNTLGITECPVCGTTNQFDSAGRCMTCGHLPAPEPFREPDLEVAQKVDMRDGWVNPNLLSAPAFVPPAEDGAGGEENTNDKQPPAEDADPVQKASSATEVVEGLEGDTMRPAAAIIASQEQQIARLSAENAVLRRRAGLVRTADEENPGQPVPEPAAQAPAQSTDEARAADATTEVTSPGSAITDVAPMTTTDVTTPGAAATDVAPDATQDVTAPVSGGAEMPSYEQSVTLVQPDASGASNGTDRTNAFEEDNSWVQQANAVRARTFACLRLAKLRIQAGLENDDDLVIAQRIEASKPSDDAIRTEIRTLTAVVQRQASTAPRRREAARTAPSLASTGSPIVSTGSASSFEADPVLW